MCYNSSIVNVLFGDDFAYLPPGISHELSQCVFDGARIEARVVGAGTNFVGEVLVGLSLVT